MTEDLVTWLRACLIEDRKKAHALGEPLILAKLGTEDAGTPWIPDAGERDALRDDLNAALAADARLLVHHFAPEWIDNRDFVLDDIDAKLAILDAGGEDGWGDYIKFPSWDRPTCSDYCGPDVWWTVVKTIAYAYRARPGYLEEWKP